MYCAAIIFVSVLNQRLVAGVRSAAIVVCNFATVELWVMFLASFQLFLFHRSASRVSHILIPPYNLCISLVSSLLQAGFGFDSKLLLQLLAARQMACQCFVAAPLVEARALTSTT